LNMATIQIMLRDAESGLVDVETTVTGAANTPAVQLAGRIVEFLGEIAESKTETVKREEVTA
jgi:hypothetical protein